MGPQERMVILNLLVCQENLISSNMSTFSVPGTMLDPRTHSKYDSVSAMRSQNIAGHGTYINCYCDECYLFVSAGLIFKRQEDRAMGTQRKDRMDGQCIFRNYF